MSYQPRSFTTKRSNQHGRASMRPRFSAPKNNGRRGPKKDYINPSQFVKVAKPQEQQDYTAQHSFNDFDVPELLKRNIQAMGITTPSPIQDQAIPLALNGQDVIGLADTGTGKTIAFALPLLRAAMLQNVQALIVAPTRELAQQIEDALKVIAQGSRLKGALLIGGTGMGKQFQDLRQNPQIVIGTPGRIKDHLERGTLNLSTFQMVVLDEVDRMLDMGFVHDVQSILSQLHNERQSLFFSATLDSRVRHLLETFSNNPATISIKTGDTSENVHQDVVFINHDGEKISKLHDLLVDQNIQKVIIFDDTQRSVERLSNELLGRGFKSDAIHGGKSQGQRQRALDRFKRSEIDVLVATDVAARGIDVSDITHVINYSTPNSYSDYVHRIGRAGRAGNVGYALTFVKK